MKIAILTAGGLAPCLSASIGALLDNYSKEIPEAELFGYLYGYQGLLKGDLFQFPPTNDMDANHLFEFGGSLLGNSRIKLTNTEDCVRRGLVIKGDLPLEIAAKQLQKDKINILHTIGGDDTNTMAAALSNYLSENNYDLTVIGLPKTVDNDIIPIKQSLGADTAADQGSIYFQNIVNENTSNPKTFIIHEVMGRHCGWLTAETARKYRLSLLNKKFNSEFLLHRGSWDIDAVYIPEMKIDLNQEANRLKHTMAQKGNVNIFLSEGSCQKEILTDMKNNNQEIEKDAFGHVRLDTINPGEWFSNQFSSTIGAEKTLVQKSGYFSRSAAPNKFDLDLIKNSAIYAVKCAMESQSGVVGLDQDDNDALSIINFDRIKGGKPFNTNNTWFQEMLQDIGQSQ
ncbi:pyrophosphate--fructose-6-phosphate 1-phosphotransferase [Candidatus Marinimicrobia bacterium]|nr:pyrophosphate--fructose-6-phosphate 1-phosphotransferase [Candidatus Neomarinimicrobiota bacterium]